MAILDALGRWIKNLQEAVERLLLAPAQGAADILEDLFRHFPFRPEVHDWVRQHIRVEVLDPTSTAGGGGWYPDRGLVRLNTAQYEAAIHELAHAHWHGRRRDRRLRDALVAAVQRLAEDVDPRWNRVHTLAGHYVHGIAEQPGFEQGMLLPASEWGRGGGPRGEWNDWEMYAGLASGCMADIRLLPPYLRRFYADLFQELPPEAPSPESIAPHR
jgi:hypothetical protein